MSTILTLPLRLVKLRVVGAEELDRDEDEPLRDPEKAFSVEGYGMLVDFTLETMDASEKAWNSTWELARAGNILHYDEVGRVLDDTIGRFAWLSNRVPPRVRKMVKEAAERVPRLLELEARMPVFQAWANHVLAAWPRPGLVPGKLDLENVARCREARARGGEGYQTAESVLARVMAGGQMCAT